MGLAMPSPEIHPPGTRVYCWGSHQRGTIIGEKKGGRDLVQQDDGEVREIHPDNYEVIRSDEEDSSSSDAERRCQEIIAEIRKHRKKERKRKRQEQERKKKAPVRVKEEPVVKEE